MKRIHFSSWRIPKVFINSFFLEKAVSHAILSFLVCIDRCEMKNVEPLLLFFVDENEKLLINELLEVVIGVGTITNTSSFDTQSFRFVTLDKLKKSVSGAL